MKKLLQLERSGGDIAKVLQRHVFYVYHLAIENFNRIVYLRRFVTLILSNDPQLQNFEDILAQPPPE